MRIIRGQRVRRNDLTGIAALYLSDAFMFIMICYLLALVMGAFADRFGLLRMVVVLAPSLCVLFVLAGTVSGLYERKVGRSVSRLIGGAAIAVLGAGTLAVLAWSAFGNGIGHTAMAPSAATALVTDASWLKTSSHVAEGGSFNAGLGEGLIGVMLACVVWVVTVLINRWPLLQERASWPERFCVIAGSPDTAPLRARLSRMALQDVEIAAPQPEALANAPKIDPTALAARGIRRVLVASDAWDRVDHVNLVALRSAGIEVLSETDYRERNRGRVDPSTLTGYGLLFSPGLRIGRIDRAVRRSFDIAFSVALLVITAPLLLLTAAAIRLDSKGPILYRQTRIGFLGKPFQIMKFRSMRIDAEADGRAVWATTGDPRVTRVGRFIRLCRIDELPQLFNVLAGDMSVIGPRPERPEFVAVLSERIPHYDTRTCAKPGITGWAQVNYPYGASVEDARMKLEYDLYYIKHRNIWLDLQIILATIRVVLRREGAR